MAKGMTAADIADKIIEKKLKEERSAYASLRDQCVAAIDGMIDELGSEVEIELSDRHMLALTKVTEEMRDLGYKFAFIEVQDSSGNIKGHKLRISIKHAMGADLNG